MQGLHVDHRFRVLLRHLAEYPGRALQELISIRISSPFIAATATFALNTSLWFRRCRLAMDFSSLAAIMLPLLGKSTDPGCTDFPNHLYHVWLSVSATSRPGL